MNHQRTFADSEFNGKRRKTRKEIFLTRMDKLLAVIKPVYPRTGNNRWCYSPNTIPRILSMQQWYNLRDDTMEDAHYKITSMCLFARFSLRQAIPDRTSIMNFRHLPERYQLAHHLFGAVNKWLSEAGIMVKQGRWSMPLPSKLPVASRTNSSSVITRYTRPRMAIGGISV